MLERMHGKFMSAKVTPEQMMDELTIAVGTLGSSTAGVLSGSKADAAR